VLPEHNTRQGFFERPDLEAVVTALPAYLQDFTRFAYLSGWRKGEIISLRWSDVDRDAGAIRLRPEAAKTGPGRTVMLEGDLAELVDRRWEARLFEKDGNVRIAALVFHRESEPVGDFRKAWATACQAAGVPDRLSHDLRRTAARNTPRFTASLSCGTRPPARGNWPRRRQRLGISEWTCKSSRCAAPTISKECSEVA